MNFNYYCKGYIYLNLKINKKNILLKIVTSTKMKCEAMLYSINYFKIFKKSKKTYKERL